MAKKLIDSAELVSAYLDETDWRIKENSSTTKSVGALTKYLAGEISKNYWLNTVYTPEIKNAYLSGSLHIHDLSALTLYCCGYSLQDILFKGVCGVPNIPVSSPAKHFDSALNQIANMITVFQNEIAGAVAFNSMDTILAPFIYFDGLTEKQVKQSLQNFIYSINSNSRGGAEPAFSNITLDVCPTASMKTAPIIIGGEYQSRTYGEFDPERDIFNKCFAEIMLAGDSKGRPFAYPIVTYNIGKSFNWDSPIADLIFEMAGKYGYPYFTNYINSEIGEDDARSMCCRLKLDLRELRRRNGGLFGSGDNTGSIGVVTINLPRIGYLATSESNFFDRLSEQLELAKDSLELKRKFLETKILPSGLLPAFSYYVGTLNNHFSTIGEIGKNEMCLNFLHKDILSPEGKAFSLKVGEYIRNKLSEFQEETGNLYNYEATPAEGTCYRLAKKDRELYPNIITAGVAEAPYYTNSCHIPVGKVGTIKEIFDHQDDLQVQYTGGTVVHLFMNGAISGQQAKHIVKTVLSNYRVPYISLSPVNRYCPDHGYIEQQTFVCPKCGKQLEIYQRVTGYLRKVSNFNTGKTQEFAERKQLNGDQI